MRQVEEALARQVIYGGDLVTNLLEVARVDEAVLAKLLAESMKLPLAPPGELPLAPEGVRALVPPEMASKRSVVPFAVENEKKLVLAVAEPLPPELEDQLSFALGMPIEQRSATAVRVRQAISRLYGVPLERRMQRLLSRLSGIPAAAGSMPPPLGSMPPIPKAPSPPDTLLMEAGPRRTGTPSYGTVSPARDSSEPAVPARRRKTITGLPAMRLISAQPPALEAAAPGAEGTRPVPESEESSISSQLPGRRGGLLQREVSATARAPRRRRGPITASDARHEAEQAANRDALLESLLRLLAPVLRLCGALPRPRRHRRGARRLRRGSPPGASRRHRRAARPARDDGVGARHARSARREGARRRPRDRAPGGPQSPPRRGARDRAADRAHACRRDARGRLRGLGGRPRDRARSGGLRRRRRQSVRAAHRASQARRLHRGVQVVRRDWPRQSRDARVREAAVLQAAARSRDALGPAALAGAPASDEPRVGAAHQWSPHPARRARVRIGYPSPSAGVQLPRRHFLPSSRSCRAPRT